MKQQLERQKRKISVSFVLVIVAIVFFGGFGICSLLLKTVFGVSWREIALAGILFGGFFLSWAYTLNRLKNKDPKLIESLFTDPTPAEQLENEKLLGITRAKKKESDSD